MKEVIIFTKCTKCERGLNEEPFLHQIDEFGNLVIAENSHIMWIDGCSKCGVRGLDLDTPGVRAFRISTALLRFHRRSKAGLESKIEKGENNR